MRTLLLALTLATLSCSQGRLDLTRDDPNGDGYYSCCYNPYDGLQLKPFEIGTYAARGYRLYTANITYEGTRFYSSYNGTSEEVLWPAGGEAETLIRRTIRFQDEEQRYHDGGYCALVSESRLTDESDAACIAANTFCGTATTLSVDRVGRNPCIDAALQSFPVRLDRGTATVGLAGSPANVPLELRATGLSKPWRSVSATNAPSALVDPASYEVAPGKVFVWGKGVPSGAYEGAIYDLDTDAWTPVAKDGMPQPSGLWRSVWTGDRVVVLASDGKGAAYDPAANAWTALKTEGAPSYEGGGKSGSFVMAFGAGQVFVFGTAYGRAGGGYVVGAMYDLQGAAWRAMSVENAPLAPDLTGAIWTGKELLVWSPAASQGKGFYYPDTNRWRPLVMKTALNEQGTTPPAIETADAHLLALDGGKIMVHPIPRHGEAAVGYAAIFDPLGGTWTKQWLYGGEPRQGVRPIQTGAWMFVFGGALVPTSAQASDAAPAAFAKGGFFTTVASGRTVQLPDMPSAPEPRTGAVTVLSGDRLLVWGGCSRSYDGICESWRADGATARVLLP